MRIRACSILNALSRLVNGGRTETSYSELCSACHQLLVPVIRKAQTTIYWSPLLQKRMVQFLNVEMESLPSWSIHNRFFSWTRSLGHSPPSVLFIPSASHRHMCGIRCVLSLHWGISPQCSFHSIIPIVHCAPCQELRQSALWKTPLGLREEMTAWT